jgi:hypothetical protein
LADTNAAAQMGTAVMALTVSMLMNVRLERIAVLLMHTVITCLVALAANAKQGSMATVTNVTTGTNVDHEQLNVTRRQIVLTTLVVTTVSAKMDLSAMASSAPMSTNVLRTLTTVILTPPAST